MADLVISSLVEDNKYSTTIKTADHEFMADEPESLGGYNKGPTPADLAMAGLGSCTAITLKMYYDRKNIKWDQIDVHTSFEVKKAEDVELSDEEMNLVDKGRVRVVYKTIYIKSDMDEDAFNRADYISSRCPVYLMMKNSVKSITKVIRVK